LDLRGRTILVTGGGGFLGSHLCETLLERGARVKTIDNFTSGRTSNLAGIVKRLELIDGSIADEQKVKEAYQGVDAVVHAAFPMALRQRSLETGAVTDAMAGLFNLLKGSVKNRSLFIYISSIAVYGEQKYIPIDEKHPLEPVLLYGAVKLSGEHFCSSMARSHGLKAAVLRVADIYGPKNTRINLPVQFLLDALNGRPLKIFGSGRQSRTYTYIDDYLKAVCAALAAPAAAGQIFNISSGRAVSVHDLAILAKNISGGKVEITFEKGETDDRQLIIDNSLSRQVLNLGEPVGLEEGLSATWDWLRNNPHFYEI